MSQEWKHPDRRQETDRRTASRQGKYDRRRNRCLHCRHFEALEEAAIPSIGLCQQYQQTIEGETFACTLFEVRTRP